MRVITFIIDQQRKRKFPAFFGDYIDFKVKGVILDYDRSDNRSEFTTNKVKIWLSRVGVKNFNPQLLGGTELGGGQGCWY